MGTHLDIRNKNNGSGMQQNNNGSGIQNISFVNSFDIANPHRSLLASSLTKDRLMDIHVAHRTLWDAVGGIGASHNSEQQYERGECLPKTREKVVERIFNWILSPGEHPLLWLTGAAGVGKSAIAITVAKLCQKNGCLVASFFFFRPDPKRNNPSALILTIAYGLVTTRPTLRNPIEQRISRDPMILEARMEEQFQELVKKPLAPGQPHLKPSFREKLSTRIGKLSGKPQTQVPNLVIVDGLDECGDEQTQKRILSTIQSAFEDSPSFPLRFLICSRPEPWLRDVFNTPSLQALHECVVLDKSFSPDEDIIRYYNHHFQEIRADPQYSQVKFPTPWPSKADFETLIERTDNQFAYAATAIRFIRQAFSQPIEQLQIILRYTPPRRPGTLPFERLDALYSFILDVNPHRKEALSILAAILVISSGGSVSAACPACIELILGLPSGQVASTLRGMHSVLDIHGSDHVIRLFHNSFREYLLDPNRSGLFYIDESIWTHIIARMWLQNLSTTMIRSYSSDQLWDKGNMLFFGEWIDFCSSIPEPTRDLLDVLQNVDLAATLVISGFTGWKGVYARLAIWVKRYHFSSKAGENEDSSEIGGDDSTAGDNQRLTCTANGYPYDNGQREVEAPGRDERHGLVLVGSLVDRFQKDPQCFHLEWPPDVHPADEAVHYIVRHATGCLFSTRLDRYRPSAVNNVRLTECRCDLSGGKEQRDPWHLAYQEACLNLVKAYIFLFEELSQIDAAENKAIRELGSILLNMTQSLILKHCRLDTEVLSLCRTFFGLAKGCLVMRISSEWGEKGKENLFRWFETFPARFAAEGEALKAQILGLPWERWHHNWYEADRQ